MGRLTQPKFLQQDGIQAKRSVTRECSSRSPCYLPDKIFYWMEMGLQEYATSIRTPQN